MASAWSNSDVIPLFCALGGIVQLVSSGMFILILCFLILLLITVT